MKMRRNRLWWSGGLAVIAMITLAAQNPDDLSSSVVRITTPVGQGSGIVVTAERDFVTILTMYHVLAGAERYDVVFAGASDRGPFQATIKDVVNWQTSDETYGLAAFRVRGAIPAGVVAAPTGDSRDAPARRLIGLLGLSESNNDSTPGRNPVVGI